MRKSPTNYSKLGNTNKQKSRATSLTNAPLFQPPLPKSSHLTLKDKPCRTERSKSICSLSLYLPAKSTTNTRGSLSSISEHFSSLLSISSQVIDNCRVRTYYCLDIFLTGCHQYWRKSSP